MEKAYPWKGEWALILGASSGFGEACAIELARHGMNIFGVHLDRKATLPNVERITGEIHKLGAQALFFNVNAADDAKRAEVLNAVRSHLDKEKKFHTVRILFHSLAFGTLKRFITSNPEDVITKPQLEMTLDVMANSLLYWTQDMTARKLLGERCRIYAMTSAGSSRVWPSYGAVSAAKAALESHIRQLAVEMASMKVTANAIRAGVTDTPSLRKIPAHEEMLRMGYERNPHRRITTPADVAKAVVELSRPGTEWMTGNVIGIDGGEFFV